MGHSGTFPHNEWEEPPQAEQMQTEVKNPDFVREFEVDDKGRINLGIDYAGERVKAAVGVIDSDEQTES